MLYEVITVSEHLARFKVPEHVWIQDDQLPRTASGKIYKRGIREEMLKRLAIPTDSYNFV